MTKTAMTRRRQIGLAVLMLLAAASVLLVAASAWAQSFPALTGRVVDAANIIPDDQEAQLAQKLAALETQSHRQLVVATLPSLEGYEISDYGYRLGRSWGIGSKENNDGALLIVAPNERKVRIEVGYGLEGIVTDGLSSLIIQDTILPKFKADDMPGGIEAGTDALIAQLTLPEDQARQLAAQAKPAQAQGDVGFPLAFFGFMFFLLFIMPMLRRARGRPGYRPSGVGSIILWSVLDAMASGRGGSGGGGFSGGGGSFGGGGGFSGGGGSFGGGGSSGSW